MVSPLVILLSIFIKIYSIRGEESPSVPYSTYLSNGLYLEENPSPIIHTHFTKLLFHLPFEFVPDTTVYSNFYNSSCAPTTTNNNARQSSSFCLILPHLIHLFSRLSLELANIRFNLLNHQIPSVTYTPDSDTGYPPLSSNISSEETSSEVLNESSNSQHGRRKRQIILGSIAAITTYKIWNLFSNSGTIDALKNDLTRDVNHLQEGIVAAITLTKKVQAINDVKYLTLLKQIQSQSKHETIEHSQLSVMLAELTRNLIQTTNIISYQNLLVACQNQKLSTTLFSHDELKTHLVSINNKLGEHDFKIAFPLENLSVLYQLPIVDCLLTSQTNQLTISIRLPIIKVNNKYKLYSGTSVPFKYKAEICSLKLPKFELLSINRNELLLVDRHTNLMCLGILCQYIEHVPSNWEHHSCLTSLTSQSTTLSTFHRLCPLHCSPTEGSNMKITKLDAWHYAIINSPPSASLLHFKSSNFVQREVEKTEPLISTNGCVVIKLSCHTQIYVNPSLTISPPSNCPDLYETTIKIVTLWPFQWSNSDDKSLLMLRSISHELTAMQPVNLTSVSSLDAINKDLTIKYKWIQHPVAKSVGNFMHTFMHEFYLYMQMIWAAIVTILLGFLWIRVGKFCSNGSSSSGISSSVLTALLAGTRRVESKPLTEDDVLHHFILFLSLIGCIFLLFLVCILIILFAFFKSYWIRNAHKHNKIKGCVWTDAREEIPYLPGTSRDSFTNRAGMPSNVSTYSFPKSIPVRPELHPLRELEREKSNLNYS